MILTGSEILKEYRAGRIVINPFDEKYLNPNSYDVTLGKGMKLLAQLGAANAKDVDTIQYIDIGHDKDNYGEYYYLSPGTLYIGTTAEQIGSDYFLPHLHGKSSIGRMGISIHQTAGRGDVGFKWNWTLEISVFTSIRVYVGMRIGQIEFHEVKGDITLYNGKYVGQNEATGARKEKE